MVFFAKNNVYVQNECSDASLTAQVPVKTDIGLRRRVNCFQSGHEVREAACEMGAARRNNIASERVNDNETSAVTVQKPYSSHGLRYRFSVSVSQFCAFV